MATKTKPTSKAVAKKQGKMIFQQWAKKTIELLQDAKFPPRTFKLNRQRPSLTAPDIMNAIGLKFGRLFLQAKTIFHIEQVKVEIACLKMLTTYSCRRINELESELKYLKRLEEIRAKEFSILIIVQKQ